MQKMIACCNWEKRSWQLSLRSSQPPGSASVHHEPHQYLLLGMVAGWLLAHQQSERIRSRPPGSLQTHLTCKLVVAKEGQDPKMVPPLSAHHAILAATSGLIFCGWLTQ